MIDVQKTDEFNDWLEGLRDARAKAKILTRIDRLALGNPGDVKPIGDGLSEMRIHYGPGYRVYYKQIGNTLIIILCGGDKAKQDQDIAIAKQLAAEI